MTVLLYEYVRRLEAPVRSMSILGRRADRACRSAMRSSEALGPSPGVSWNGALQKSAGVVSDTGQSVKFKLQLNARVDIAGAIDHIAPGDEAQAPAARAVLQARQLIELLLVLERIDHASISAPVVRDRPRDGAVDLLNLADAENPRRERRIAEGPGVLTGIATPLAK